MDIMLDLERLRAAKTGLSASIDEFERAARANDDLEAAVGRPDDRTQLRDVAHDFEAAWNDKREALKDNLRSIEARLQGIVDNWEQWDAQTAADLESGGATPQQGRR